MNATNHDRMLKVVIATVFALFVVMVVPWMRNAILNQAKSYYLQRVEAPRAVGQFVKASAPKKLHLGAGQNVYPGWLNTDIEPLPGQIYLDVSRRFPFPDESVHYIYSEHLIEHLPYETGAAMLRECQRVLVKGGKFRVATPDLLKFISVMSDPLAGDSLRFVERKRRLHNWPETVDPGAYVLNMEMRWWGHEFVYTPALLLSAMAGAGFSDIRECEIGESTDRNLRGLESRGNTYDALVNSFETMVFEGTK